MAAALLVPARPLNRPTDSINVIRTACLARQRIVVLADLMRNGVECMQFGQLQMLLYTNQEPLSSNMRYHCSSVMSRRTEALLEEQQCAAFLVCMAACLTSRTLRAWYCDAEALLGECLYGTLCNNSGARRCAYEQVPELNAARQSLDAYRTDAQEQWANVARQRAQRTVVMLQRALSIDEHTGMLGDTSPHIPEETEDMLFQLKTLLLTLYEQHCSDVAGEEVHRVGEEE